MSHKDGLTPSRTSLLKSNKYQQVKQHIIYDANNRPLFVFTAPIDAVDQAPCTCTEYVYLGASSTLVRSRQEREYRWKAVWEDGFTFDGAVDYDSDGDGIL